MENVLLLIISLAASSAKPFIGIIITSFLFHSTFFPSILRQSKIYPVPIFPFVGNPISFPAPTTAT
jgi:hypothetical protein